MSIEQRLKDLNITLPKVGGALGNYVHAKRIGNLLYLSGKGPESGDGTMPKGKLGAGMSIEEGYRHARQVGLVLIAAIKDALGGDLDRLEGIVKVLGMVNAAPDFEDHPKVVNGCSDLFVEVFGEGPACPLSGRYELVASRYPGRDRSHRRRQIIDRRSSRDVR
jgi:enamine deaminase RidA (YjgF/YER057c/UK114 family)